MKKLRTYSPKNKIELNYRGLAWFIFFSESFLIFSYGIFSSVSAFLGFKKLYKEFRMKREKVLDLRDMRFKRII